MSTSALLLVVCLASAVLTLALDADVVVTGTATFRNVADVATPAENLVGIAPAASQGAITAAQLETRPIMRAGDVLESVPGMIASQHSSESKANQYYLRGFNLDHGTDFSVTVAGVPRRQSLRREGRRHRLLLHVASPWRTRGGLRRRPHASGSSQVSTRRSARLLPNFTQRRTIVRVRRCRESQNSGTNAPLVGTRTAPHQVATQGCVQWPHATVSVIGSLRGGLTWLWPSSILDP